MDSLHTPPTVQVLRDFDSNFSPRQSSKESEASDAFRLPIIHRPGRQTRARSSSSSSSTLLSKPFLFGQDNKRSCSSFRDLAAEIKNCPFSPQLCNTDSSLHDFYDDDDYNDQPDLTLQNDNSVLTFHADGTDDTDTEGAVASNEGQCLNFGRYCLCDLARIKASIEILF